MQPAFFVMKMPETVIVDLHHEVLPFWEKCRDRLGRLPQVLSLDFHTDVLNAQRRGIECGGDVCEAVKLLHHDEHFDWALRSGVICRAVILALSPCAVLPEHPALEVRRSELLPDMDVMLNRPEKFRSAAEMVLDDRCLSPLLRDGCPQEPYILDIDCDYIMCGKALEPEYGGVFAGLAANAELVTLSRENDWVRILKLPGEKISGSYIAERVAARFNS